jgi:hypothetical protein
MKWRIIRWILSLLALICEGIWLTGDSTAPLHVCVKIFSELFSIMYIYAAFKSIRYNRAPGARLSEADWDILIIGAIVVILLIVYVTWHGFS